MQDVAPVVETAEDETTWLKVEDFPRDLKVWLEQRALARKHERRERHASMGRTLAEIVREAKERDPKNGGGE